MAEVVCIGHATVDIFFQLTAGHLQPLPNHEVELCVPFPNKVYIPQRTISLGGNAVNVGVSLLKNNHQVQLISRTGEDKLGQLIYQDLKEYGFDLTYTSREGESDSSVILNHQEDRTILSYHGETMYQFPGNLPAVEWIYLSSLGFEDYPTFHRQVLDWFKAHATVPIIYNPGKHEIKQGFATVEDLAQIVHTLILNLEEAQVMLTTKEKRVGHLLNQYLEQGVKNTIITDGKDGVYYSHEKDVYYHHPSLSVPVIDATGAGDAFSAGYLLGLIERKSAKEALRYGVAQSASVIQVTGATHGVKTINELEDMLQSHDAVQLEECYVE